MIGVNLNPQIQASVNQFMYQWLEGQARTGEGLKKINSLIDRFSKLQRQPIPNWSML
jgi:hypothetical protein